MGTSRAREAPDPDMGDTAGCEGKNVPPDVGVAGESESGRILFEATTLTLRIGIGLFSSIGESCVCVCCVCVVASLIV